MTTAEISAELHQQRYRIRQQLGKGGFGAVYLADDLRLPGRQVALKENLGVNTESKAQFKREALLLARLHHPNLPQVTDYFFDTGGKQYLVMDYVPGDNLRQLMAQYHGALPVDEALSAVEQVMQALAYMHAWRDPETGEIKPIIHRDIKPDNIKRTPDGRFVLVDFGIAKVDTDTATALSARALTPGYAPIEQYHGGTDERSDVYALAATLYALLTGKAPPSATSLATGLPLPPLRSFNASIPMRCVKVIDKAMQFKPEERYQSIGDMYRALFDRTMPMTGSVPPPVSSHQQPAASAPRPQRSSVVAGILVVGALLAVLGIGWALLSAPTVESGVAGSGAAASPSSTRIAAGRPGQTQQVTPLEAATEAIPTEEPATIAVTAAAAVTDTQEPPTPRATNTPAPAATDTAMPLVAEAATSTTPALPTQQETARPAPPQPLPTSTPRPTSTALPTSTPRPTATATHTAAPTAQMIGVSDDVAPATGGPTSAEILRPGDYHSSNSATEFSWRPNAPLEAGQEYEVVFWKANEAESTAKGLVRSSPTTSSVQPVGTLTPDTYLWALWLVQPEPYSRIRQLAGPFAFTVPANGESRGGSAPEPTEAKTK